MSTDPNDRPSEGLRFRVWSVFTITGRGLVVGGRLEQGVVSAGDRLAIHHDGRELATTCRGVDLISGGPPGPRDLVGLSLPEVCQADVAEGDLITGFGPGEQV